MEYQNGQITYNISNRNGLSTLLHKRQRFYRNQDSSYVLYEDKTETNRMSGTRHIWRFLPWTIHRYAVAKLYCGIL